MKKIFLIAVLCFTALTEHAGAKSVKLWTTGSDDDGRGLAVRDNDRTICPKGKTKSGSVCVSCETVLSNCEWCSSTTVCTKCQKGYIVKDGKCKKNGCDTDDECEANQSCDTIARKCETLDCPRGTYLKDHKCLKCPDECTECTSATFCTACKTNYELEGTECTQIKCPAGQYVEHSECHPCSEAIENCVECATSKTCTKCDEDMILENGKCVEPKCRTDADCAETEKCNGTTKMCEKVVCDDGYRAENHTCIPEAEPECDANTDCEDNEVCVDGGTETAACRQLECNGPNQRAENHECVTDECVSNEDCPDTQKCENKVCAAVTCDHACYIAGNHQCVKKSEECCVTDLDCEPGTCLKTPKAQTGICRDSTCTYTDANTCKNNTPNCKYCKKDGNGCYTCSMYNETASGCTESQTEFELYGVKFCCPSGVVAGQTPNWYNRCMQETQDAPNSCVCKSTSECGYVKVGGWCVWNGNGNQCSAQWCENM